MAPHAFSARSWAPSLRLSTHSLLTLTLVFSLLMSVAHSQYYFIVTEPSASASWANGSPYPFSWTKGLLDGLDSFDIEMTRLNEDGLYLIAQNVPSTYGTLNIQLEDVPPGDDYFMICLNTSNSIIYGISSRFSVADSSSVASNPSPDASVPTVTISGTPNPPYLFATTIGPALNGAGSLLFGDSPNKRVLGLGVIVSLCAALLGGVMTLW